VDSRFSPVTQAKLAWLVEIEFHPQVTDFSQFFAVKTLLSSACGNNVEIERDTETLKRRNDMSQNQELVEALNEVLSWELAGIIQNLNHSMMITGLHRLEYKEFFEDNSEENREHAELVGNKITAFGGIPTVEPARIRQATSLEDMLEAGLALEEQAMEAWLHALDVAEKTDVNAGTQFWLEDMIGEEQEHIDDFRMLTEKITFNKGQLPASGERSA
jgi:bacterioferritin